MELFGAECVARLKQAEREERLARALLLAEARHGAAPIWGGVRRLAAALIAAGTRLAPPAPQCPVPTPVASPTDPATLRSIAPAADRPRRAA